PNNGVYSDDITWLLSMASATASRTSTSLRWGLWRLKPQCSYTGPAVDATVKLGSVESSSPNCSWGCVKMMCASPALRALICESVSATNRTSTPSMQGSAPWLTT